MLGETSRPELDPRLPDLSCPRFDLVFLILDPQDEQYDKKLGRHLVSLYFKDESAEEDENFSMKVLRDYIKYAKDKFSPVLSDEAGQMMISYYVEMRKVILS